MWQSDCADDPHWTVLLPWEAEPGAYKAQPCPEAHVPGLCSPVAKSIDLESYCRDPDPRLLPGAVRLWQVA